MALRGKMPTWAFAREIHGSASTRVKIRWSKISPNDAIRVTHKTGGLCKLFSLVTSLNHPPGQDRPTRDGLRFAHAFVETTALDPVANLDDLELVSCDFRCACRSRAS